MDDGDLLAGLRRRPIAPTEKGFGGPAHRSPVTAEWLAAERPAAGGGLLGSPRALLRRDALDGNVAAMAAYCDAHGAVLYPHGKTTMAPQLFALQLRAGAGGITAATMAQVRLYRHFGVRDVLLANELVDEPGIAWLARELDERPEFSFACYVDSVAGVELLDAALGRHGFGGRLRVLVELGHAGGRSGCRDRADALAVTAAAGTSRRLLLAGVAGYEGSIVGPTVEDTLAAARGYCEGLGELAAELSAAGRFEERPTVTAGGSAYFDAVVDALGGGDWRLVLRSGCYVLHDHGFYGRVSPFARGSARVGAGGLALRPALEVWAPVLSRPEPGVAVLGAGRRDLSFDTGDPVPLGSRAADGTEAGVAGYAVERLFDQHVVVTVPPDAPVAPGDEVRLGISHPCTTMDKWRWLPVVDAEDRVVDAVRTFF
jgi:D-serine deaminase-like pyridoxal phosphate-dependent protein